MNLFVTGGTGFFGKALLRYWKNNNPQFKKIYFLSRSPEKFLENYSDLVKGLPIEFIKGNILKLSKVNIDQDLDVVLHAATDSTIGPTLDRLDIYQQITHGTEEALKFAINHNCKKFVLTSSGGVHGSQPSSMEKISEDYLGMPDPLDPNSAYGVGKRAAEHLTALYAEKYGFEFVIARCFAFIGEDLPLDKHFAIGNFISDALNNKDIVIKGDGSPIRSYMYQEDLAKTLTVLLTEKTKHKVYNVGSDEFYSIKEFALKVKALAEKQIELKVLSRKDTNMKNIYVPDIKRIKDEFGIYPISIETALKNSVKKIFRG